MKSKILNIFINGLLLACYIILTEVIEYAFNLKNSSFSTAYWLLSYIIFAILLFFVQKNYQKKVFSGTANYKKLFGNTIFIILIVSLINGIFIYILYKFIDTNAIEQMLIESRNKLYEMYDGVLNEAQIENSMKMTQKLMTPLFLSITNIFSLLFWGIIFSLITSLINKAKKQVIEDSSDFDEVMKNVE